MQSVCTLLNRALRGSGASILEGVGSASSPAELDRRIERLQALRERRLALNRERKRKRDTRRKIVLGGGLQRLIKNGDRQAAEVAERVIRDVPQRDRNLFAEEAD